MKHDCEKAQPLLAKYAAGQLTQGDRQRVELMVEDCADCAATLAMLQARGNVAENPAAQLEAVESVGASIGQVLFIGGLLLVYGTGVYLGIEGVVGNADTPMPIRIGLPVLFLGLAVLGVTVLVQRMKAARTDKYKDVEI